MYLGRLAVHFSLMAAFDLTKRRKRRRRIDTIRAMASELGVGERTLRRWIVERPEVRSVLRAYRLGNQWRLGVPKTWVEFEDYKSAVKRAISTFHRKRQKRWERSTMGKEIATKLGFGDNKRERDLLILRAATELKIADTRPTSVFKAKSKLAHIIRSNRASEHIGIARIIAAKYGCDVFEVPIHLGCWVAEEPTRGRKNLARRIRQDWPTREQWDKAKDLVKSNWRKRTLNEAARECADRGRRISGPNLAPLLFHNPDREHAWKTNKKLKEQHPGDHVKLDPYAKRGISLRLFRERYDRKDIQGAKQAAEGTVRSELENKSEERDRAAAPRRLWFDVGS
jgi:hypothetical protein